MNTLEQTLDDFSASPTETEFTDLLRSVGEGDERVSDLAQKWNNELQAECDSLGETREARAEGRVRMEMRRALVYFSAGLTELAEEAITDALTVADQEQNPVLLEMVRELDGQLFN